MTTTSMTLSVVARKECVMVQGSNCERWVAQCLEYDIASQGKTLEEMKERFIQTVQGNIVLALERGVVPFSNLAPAPARYWEEYNEASEFEQRVPVSLPSDRFPRSSSIPSQVIPRASTLMRIAAAA
jgi:hypothetical protein